MKFDHLTEKIFFLLLLFIFQYNKALDDREPIQQSIRSICMKVEGQSGWLVTDASRIRLSWIPIEKVDEQDVVSYEVIASKDLSSAENGIGNIWKSEPLPITKGPWVNFDASKLSSRTEVWWRVRGVTKKGIFSKWSDISNFEIGLKNNSEWNGKRIMMNPQQRQRSAPMFRKTFHISKPIQKARLYVSGLGYHESWLNGKKLGREVLQPAQTDYEHRVFYVSHDITSQLNKGENIVGFWVGDGFYNQDIVWGKNKMKYDEPSIIAQIEISYNDGSTFIVSTDETWKCNTSAIISSNVYAGEIFNAQLFDKDWATTKYSDTNWFTVELAKNLGGKLVAQELQPCREMGKVKVKKIDKLHDNTWIFDFGQNMVGCEKLTVNASSGTVITMRFAENRLSNGELGYASSGVKATGVIQTDVYTCKGNGDEVWQPRFTYHGFRFAEVTITNGELKNKIPNKDFLEGIVIYTDMDVVGEFSSSNETLNQAFDWAYWTGIGGVQGTPTDCPIRERCGWTGDAHNIVPYTLFQFDAATMWNKYTTDIVTSSHKSVKMLCFGTRKGERIIKTKKSNVPTMVAPGKRFIGEASPDWGCAIAFIPWDVYIRTGDIRSLENNFQPIKLWCSHLQELSTNNIIYSGMGDWCAPIHEIVKQDSFRVIWGKITPMLSTACYYRSVRIAADAAKLLNKPSDFHFLDSLAFEIRKSFHNAFYNENPQLVPDQTINAIAINWDILVFENRKKVAKTLATQVQNANNHFTTGIFGLPSLFPVLCKYGYTETAWKTLQTETSPSIKYSAKRGATTFWESWPLENSENIEWTQSQNHPFQAGFVAWYFEGLAGINPSAEKPGYQIINFQPQIISGLDWIKCRFLSPMGMIESSWKQSNSILEWYIEIPFGATGNIRIPGTLMEIKKETIAIEVIHTKIIDSQGEAELTTLSSGKYIIKSKI